MSELKLKFISDQSHQKRAVDSIIQLFNGFSKIETTFKLDDEIVSNMSVDSQFNEEFASFRKDVVSVLQSQQQAINLMMDSLGLNKPKENPDGK